MRVLSLTLLYGLLTVFSTDSVWKFPSVSTTAIFKSANAHPAPTGKVAASLPGTLLQSTDGGQTWKDISSSLPDSDMPEDFFVGDAAIYMRINTIMYRSKSNGSTWEKGTDIDLKSNAIAITRSGAVAFNHEGQMYQKTAGAWMPVYTSFKQQGVETIFETADGSILIGTRSGLYKSNDKGKNWKPVQNEGWVMDIVESNEVLIARGEKGIMRSADHGDHWEWVIKEGGVGIAVERVDGGFAAISYNGTSKTRRTRISQDGGKTWQPIDVGLQPSSSISSIKQVGRYLLLGHPDGIYQSADRGKTWKRVHHGLEGMDLQYGALLNMGRSNDMRKAFKLYVSGNVVYAVANMAGC